MIDFATLKGLTIPEGVVTQITDASGMVLWSAVKSFIGTCFLRPSADISLGHPVYPETLSAGYLAINEEVSDGNATYIGYTTSSNGEISATSKFKMSLQDEYQIAQIVSAKLVIKGYLSGNYSENAGTTAASCNGSVSILGEKAFEWNERRTSGTVQTFSYDMPNFVTILNNYITAGNESIPEVTIEITNSIEHKNKAGQSYVSQVAIELECV